MLPDLPDRSKKLFRIIGVLLFAGTFNSVLLCASASEEDPESESRAGRIMQQVYDNSVGQNRVSREVLTLVQPGQRPRTRHLNLFRKVDDHEVRTLVRFTDPASIRRTGLLSIERQDGSVDQWIFIPAARAVRRIPGERKGDRFAASDFFYEDILLRMAAGETYRWVSAETLEGQPVDLIESSPSRSQTSVYSRRLFWIDLNKKIPLRIDFFQEGEATPFKRFETLDTVLRSGQYIISKAVMRDLETGHASYLQSESIKHDADLPDHLFTTQALEDGLFEAEYAPLP